eukprot:s299_g25.t1
MATLRMIRTPGEIESYRREMEVPEVPKDPFLLLDLCIMQWNKLNKVQLRFSIENFAHTAGYGKEDRKTIHLWFHEMSPPWCAKLGHVSPSTCFDFIVPGAQYNKDTKHRMLEAWLAWVMIQQSEKEILAMIPDFMLFLKLLCEVYHTHWYFACRGQTTMVHPDELLQLRMQQPPTELLQLPMQQPPTTRINRWNRQRPSGSTPF